MPVNSPIGTTTTKDSSDPTKIMSPSASSSGKPSIKIQRLILSKYLNMLVEIQIEKISSLATAHFGSRKNKIQDSR